MKYAVIAAAIMLIGLGIFLYEKNAPSAGETPQGAVGNQYTNDERGVSFSYPEGYLLMAQTRGAGSDAYYSITLVRTEDATAPEGGEGPTGVTVDIYSFEDALHEWVHTAPASNFKLGDGTLASTTVAGNEAVRYRWSGLYEGESTALVSGDRLVVVSVTHLEPGDHTNAYEELLRTLTLTD